MGHCTQVVQNEAHTLQESDKTSGGRIRVAVFTSRRSHHSPLVNLPFTSCQSSFHFLSIFFPLHINLPFTSCTAITSAHSVEYVDIRRQPPGN